MAAIGATLPGAAWQRCRTHYTTNLMAVTPKASWPWVRTLLHSVFDQPDTESVGPLGREMLSARSGRAMDFTDEDRRQSRGGGSPKIKEK